MIKFLDKWLKKRRIKSIRREMLLLGCDLSNYTDEEIKKGVLRMAEDAMCSVMIIKDGSGVLRRPFSEKT